MQIFSGGLITPRSKTEKNLGTHHFGVDLNIMGGQQPQGEDGHLYIHYTQPTRDRPGCIMFGVENNAPYSNKHSKFGRADKYTPFGYQTAKREDLIKLQSKVVVFNKSQKDKAYLQKSNKLSHPTLPRKYNGVIGKLDKDIVNQLDSISINQSSFADNITYIKMFRSDL